MPKANTPRPTKRTNKPKTSAGAKPNPAALKTVHIYILLDRSGSMESMRLDVIGGLNEFISQQKAAPGQARVTFVQFDSQGPQEIMLDAVRVGSVRPLTSADFQPRGGTPLLDATGTLIERALGREATRKLAGKTQEEIVFVTITDGEENQSRRCSLEMVRRLIDGATESGWNFVFMGAGLDAYQDAERLGYASGSTQAWAADGDGAKKAWGSVSRAMHQLRSDVHSQAYFDKKEYFRGLKEAEES